MVANLANTGEKEMQQKHVSGLILLLILGSVFMSGCGGAGPQTANESAQSDSSSKTSDEGLKKSPKDSIAYQFELVKEGNVDKLKECFTERLRDGITAETVEKGKSQASKYTLDDLVASVEMGEAEGKNTAKVMMKNGRTLTTLVQTDGKWLADTVWFK
jgi:hypothetical protein